MTRPKSDSCQIANINDLLDKYFPDDEDRVFVEVGAHDGYSWSNTWGPIMCGWFGLYFEPVPELYKTCKEIHKDHRATVIQSAVGAVEGVTTLWLDDSPGGPCSTMSTEFFDLGFTAKMNSIVVPITTLNKSIPIYIGRLSFDLLVIDVEGAELDVLRGCDLHVLDPKMIIVETHKGNEDARKSIHAKEIDAILTEASFVELQSDGTNSVYWRD